MAVVLDTGAVSRGSGGTGSNRESDIRKSFVDEDLIETVILLPENLFYNTPSPGVVMLLDRAKRHNGEFLLINASKEFEKGRPKNLLNAANLDRIADAVAAWDSVEFLSVVVKRDEISRNDYNLSPSRYVMSEDEAETLSLEEAVELLVEAEKERSEVDSALRDVLRRLGLNAYQSAATRSGAEFHGS
jgi:type I restriction enzyme M protein